MNLILSIIPYVPTSFLFYKIQKLNNHFFKNTNHRYKWRIKFYLVRYCILFTSSWPSGIPSSIVVRRCAANLTPATPSGSSPCIKGWEQHVFVHIEGNVILLSDLCCNNNSPFSLNMKSENALCKGEVPSASNSWHSRLLAWPMLKNIYFVFYELSKLIAQNKIVPLV